MNLFDFNMTLPEPDLFYLGEVFLLEDPHSECGSWKFWHLCDYIADDWPLGLPSALDVDFIHHCYDGHIHGCLAESL